MCALRWGLSLGAYNKYKSLFAEPFPRAFECPSPIAQAAYIRDALRFAHDNTLPGGQFYKKVKISPEEGRVVIHLGNNTRDSIRSFPVETVFSLMSKNKELRKGYEFASTSTLGELNGFLDTVNLEAKLFENHYILQEKKE